MKRILIIIFIIAAFIVFSKIKEWYNNMQNAQVEQAARLLEMEQTIQEDSLTISNQAITLKDKNGIIKNQSQNIKNLRDKYKSTLDSYHRLQLTIDSLKADKDTIYVEPDSLDSTSAHFKESVGEGFFEIYGSINYDPLFIYNLGLRQILPIDIELTLERLSNGKYVSFMYTNVSFLNTKLTDIKILERQRWIDQIVFSTHISPYPFGGGVGLFYNNYGISYIQYVNRFGLLFNYYKNLGEIF